MDIASTDVSVERTAQKERDILYKHRVRSLLWDTPVLVFPFFVWIIA